MLNKGTEYENLAASFLRQQGASIIHQNFRCKLGEIDIIATLKNQLLFVEVKYRKNDHFGAAAEQVTMAKQRKLQRAAQYFLNSYNHDLPCRFDVLAFTGSEKPNWIQNAF